MKFASYAQPLEVLLKIGFLTHLLFNVSIIMAWVQKEMDSILFEIAFGLWQKNGSYESIYLD
jgi:hypothetical protein